MSAQSFAEKGEQKCPFCPCGNMCTCSTIASLGGVGDLKRLTEEEHQACCYARCSAEKLDDNEETEGHRRDRSVAER